MNKKMRVFPEGMMDYEKVFTDERYTGRMVMDRVQKPHGFNDIKEYRDSLRNFLISKSIQTWYIIVQTDWMMSNFVYIGKRKPTSRFPKSKTMFNIFTKEYVGISYSFLAPNFYFSKIKGYFPDFFPNFYEGNPFINPKEYAFPYKNITIDYMILVYQMPERLDLLRYADEHNLRFSVFVDFVINYIGKYNDIEKETVFVLFGSTHYPLYVKCMKK